MRPSGGPPLGHVAFTPVYLAPLGSDQGSRFTGRDWIGGLKKNDIQISMDAAAENLQGKQPSVGRWIDNVFIERLWRSLKYEKIRLYSYTNLKELRENVTEWMEFYNHKRDHQALGYTTPWSNYEPTQNQSKVA